MMLVPTEPKIYHIVHVDRLESIVSDGFLWSDAEARERGVGGTTIGMSSIKERRFANQLSSHKGLHVGECVPFYFCPRSVMLYVIYRKDHPELQYRGGQGPIVHLEADMHEAVGWANSNQLRWAFTTSNAGSSYFRDYSDLRHLNEINWDAVIANKWSGIDIDVAVKEGKQAEFLTEHSFPWHLVSRIGIPSRRIYPTVLNAFGGSCHRPRVEIKPNWYY